MEKAYDEIFVFIDNNLLMMYALDRIRYYFYG